MAASTELGVIEGYITNGTNGGNVSGLDITLLMYVDSTGPITVGSTTSDATGLFRFSELATDSIYSYIIRVRYQAVDYAQGPYSFGSVETTKRITITVYESTSSDTSITIPIAHTIMYPEDGRLYFMEYLLVANDGNRTYVGTGDASSSEEGKTLRFPLPKDVIELELGMGLNEGSIVVADDGFWDTVAIIPGEWEFTYYYLVEPDSETYKFTKTIAYPVDIWEFIILSDGIKIEASSLAVEEPVEIEGSAYIHLSGTKLHKNTIVRIDIDVAQGGKTQRVNDWVVVLALILANLIFLSLFVLWIVGRRARRIKVKNQGAGPAS
jgi:hypothetical protein